MEKKNETKPEQKSETTREEKEVEDLLRSGALKSPSDRHRAQTADTSHQETAVQYGEEGYSTEMQQKQHVESE